MTGAHAQPSNLRSSVGWIAAACAVTMAVALTPATAPWVIGAAAVASAWYMWRGQLASWQYLASFALAGYSAIGYGFANWSVRVAGLPVPIPHIFCFVALAMAMHGHRDVVNAFFREPSARAWMLLSGISVIHILSNVTRYGAGAVRDASFVAEGCFLLLGFLWAHDQRTARMFPRVLAVIFLINLAYSLTFPWSGWMRSISPTSGVFKSVTILGTYNGRPFVLALGAFLFLIVGRNLRLWTPSTLYSLAVIQLAWALVFQSRATYIGIALGIIVLTIYGRKDLATRLVTALGVGAVSLFALIAIGDIRLGGRLREVTPEFFIQHVASLVMSPDTPGSGTIGWRLEILRSSWVRWTSSLSNMLLGIGFGPVLTDFHGIGGSEIRQPHNTHVTVLLRLGLLGFAVWMSLHLRILTRLVRDLGTARPHTYHRDLTLWALVFYIFSMFVTSVQPTLEWPQMSIPFWTIIGYAMAARFASLTDAGPSTQYETR